MDFSGFVKKGQESHVPHRTFLKFWLLFQGPFLLRIFFSKYSTAYFSALFDKKRIPKE